MSLNTHTVPTLWKTAEVIPVPKKPKVSVLNDLRPVALTSIAFKCLERIVFNHISSCLSVAQDPFQFAYRTKRSVDDAILIFFDNIYRHLDIPKHYCRVLFADFSSAFNTIQPHMLLPKLNNLKVDKNIIAWVHDFLTNRQQYVKLSNVKSSSTSGPGQMNSIIFSDRITTNTGAPQGCVLSPILFTIYTNDCYSNEDNVTILKFADDSSIQGMIVIVNGDERFYRQTIDKFVKWCDDHFLLLNVSKTKEVIFYFRNKRPIPTPISIKNENVEIVAKYKYLGVTISEDLSWTEHISRTVSKLNQRLYFLRKLRSFGIDKTILKLFYTSVIQSVFTFCIASWGGNAAKTDTNKISRTIEAASRVCLFNFESFTSIYNELCFRKITNILQDPTHPLYGQIIFSERSGRPLSLPCKRNRYLLSFMPSAVRILQSNKVKKF